MAKSLSSSFKSTATLRNKILFTLGVLLVYRLGTYVPIPGVNPAVIAEIMQQYSDGIIGMFNVFSGGALGRMTVFALNIIPYITASIVMQLLVAMLPSLSELKKEGEAGRRQINQYTRYLTLVVCLVQSFSIAIGLESLSDGGMSAVNNPGLLFKVTTAFTLTGGTFFVLWMGEKITEKGIGNGISLIIFAGIVSNLPFAISALFSLGEKGSLSVLAILSIVLMVVLIIYGVVYFETAQRRVTVKYPRRQVGLNKQSAGDTSYLPLKINNAGVIPPIFASSILLVPATIFSFLTISQENFLANLAIYFDRGSSIYLFLYALLIVLFAFFYVSIVFNSQETAENLKNHGGVIIGIRPGQDTANHLNYILKKLTVIGSAYLVIVCLLPEILITNLALPFYFGGTSLLIVVTVTIDTITNIQSHMMSAKYENVLKKAKIGRGRR